MTSAGCARGRSGPPSTRRARWLTLAVLVCLPPALLPRSPGHGQTASSPSLPAGLSRIAGTYSPGTTATLESLKRGIDHNAAGRYAAALESLPSNMGPEAAAIADYALLHRARASLMLGDAETALRGFRTVTRRFSASPLQGQALLGETQALLKLRDAPAALDVLRNPKLEDDAETGYLRGQAWELAGRTPDAVECYLDVFSRFPATSWDSQAERRLKAISPRFAKNPSHYGLLLHRSQNLLGAGRNRDARALLIQLGAVRPVRAADADLRLLLLAEADYNLDRTSTALASLRKISDRNPSLHARSLNLEALCLRKQGKEASFLAVRDRMLKLYPESPEAEKLLYSVATYFDTDNRVQEATAAYRRILEDFPRGEYVRRALWKVAVYAFSARSYDEALRLFWKYLQAFPEPGSAGGTLYWMARSYERLGDSGAASHLYARAHDLANGSYYGQLAGDAAKALAEGVPPGKSAAGVDFEPVARLAKSIRHVPVAFVEPSGQASVSVERARLLTAAGLPDAALDDLRRAIRRFPGERGLSYLAASIADYRADHLTAITLLRRAIPDYESRPPSSLPLEVWDLLFPVKHAAEIAHECGKRGLDPALVLGLIRQESAFDEGARSTANAHGLMQILPSTGRKLARQAGLAKYSARRLDTASTNLVLGTLHFAELLERFGRIELALAAYNAGPNRVERWLQQFGDIDTPQFVERIPFSETRGYVRQVLTNRFHYRYLVTLSAQATR